MVCNSVKRKLAIAYVKDIKTKKIVLQQTKKKLEENYKKVYLKMKDDIEKERQDMKRKMELDLEKKIKKINEDNEKEQKKIKENQASLRIKEKKFKNEKNNLIKNHNKKKEEQQKIKELEIKLREKNSELRLKSKYKSYNNKSMLCYKTLYDLKNSNSVKKKEYNEIRRYTYKLSNTYNNTNLYCHNYYLKNNSQEKLIVKVVNQYSDPSSELSFRNITYLSN